MKKERVDILLVEQNLAETREKAKRLIMAGLVFIGQERIDKAGTKIARDSELTVKGNLKYVSRGGFKLEKALQVFSLDLSGKTMVDIGSSTGGFSDCALQNGAAHIYAIDVGSNQLAWKIRSDERVSVHEKTNFRYVTKELFVEGLPNFATIDVSFISLRLILPTLKTILAPNSHVVALIKPQFEAEREQVGRKGIIREKQLHTAIVEKVLRFALDEGFEFIQLDYSPITGAEGNIEFLAHFGYQTDHIQDDSVRETVEHVVQTAHDQLSEKAKERDM